MKKLALILAMVCFVLALGAQEFKPEASVSGSATATVGFNLDTNVLALSNGFDGKVKLSIVPKASAEKGQKEGTYGYIKMIDFEIKIENTQTITAPKVTAKIISGPIFVQIMDESNATKTISVGQFGLPNITDDNILSPVSATKIPAGNPTAGGYLYAGYDSDMFDLTLKVVNNNSTCTDAKNAKAIWWIAPSAAVTVSGATVKAGALFTTIEKGAAGYQFPGIGASLSYSMDLMKVGETQVTLAPSAGFDYVLGDAAATTSMAIGAAVFAKWGGNDEFKGYLKVDQTTTCTPNNTYTLSGDVKYQGGAGAAVQYVKAGTADAKINAIVQVNEQRGDAGLVKGLGFDLGVSLNDLTGKNPATAVGAFANYKLDNVTPYVRTIYKAAVGAVNASMTFGAGADVANILPNTTLTADYNTWDALASTNNLGLFTVSAKISF